MRLAGAADHGMPPARLVHLRSSSSSVVLDVGSGVPCILHWGAALAADIDLDAFAAAFERPIANGELDVVGPLALVPEHGSGFAGRPGLIGSRPDGTAWSPRFVIGEWHAVIATGAEPGLDGDSLQCTAVDSVAKLTLTTDVHLEPTGVLTITCTLSNDGDTAYRLSALTVSLALPAAATELLTFTGRHTRELHPQRRPFDTGALVAENRRGRTSHEHLPFILAGVGGFGEWQGEVWSAHLAWSGNHTIVAECLADGRRYLQLGELLHDGEIALAPGASYATPRVVATYAANGMTAASQSLHRHLRARSTHPHRARPVLLNTWEAVYFDHDTDRLKALADAAASVGIERFVLDDGWFGARRNDRAGLGDWWVSPDVYPDGLAPLIAHVRSLGMEFGIWVEPEMVNPESDLFRAHPEWALVTAGYEPVLGRYQLVLDLANPAAYEHVFAQLDALLRDHDIAYVKWDMNRDHAQASGADGRAGTHAQTLALYRMLDELNARHPDVEIESCSSGGARIDHEILQRTVRVWTSDCNDALERQTIQRGASLLIPPELMGAHIGPTISHTTGRRHALAFRAITALFGHLGVEWNLLDATAAERDALRDVIAVHKRLRPLLHGGDVVRFDVPGGNGAAGFGSVPSPAIHAHGVYAPDRSEAVVAVVQLRTADSLTPPPLRLPGLDPDRRYRIELVPIAGQGRLGSARRQPAWLRDGIDLTGAQLAAHGLQLPVMHPETAILLHLTT